MQGSIFVDLACVTFDVRLHLSLHDTANCDYVSTNTGIDKIVFDFTLNRLRHLTRVNIIDVVFYLLNLQSLVERGPGCVFLRIENSASTIDVDASIWRLPLSIDEANYDLGFAFVASELDGFHKDLDGGNPEHSASDANVLVDQVGLNHAHRKDLIKVVETQDDNSMV